MTRLSSYRQKQFKQRLIIYLVLIVGLMIFMLTIGFKLLINTGLFISGISSSNKNLAPQTKKDDFYGSLSMDTMPSATNSARIVVSGLVNNYNSVEFYINGEKVKESSFQSSDYFSEEIGDLTLGSNEVYVKAVSKKNNAEKESPKFTVVYKNEKPKLEVTNPSSDPSTTNKSPITFSGKTDKGIIIKINGVPIVVSSDNSFQTLFDLKVGDNQINITAEDDAGNIETKTFNIKFSQD